METAKEIQKKHTELSTSRKFTTSLQNLVSQGQRVLLIEQNLKFASTLCEEIVILSNGEIQATVSSKELRASAELQNKYLGVA